MADYTLSAKITGDAAEFAKAFKIAEESTDGFEAKFEKFSKNWIQLAVHFKKPEQRCLWR